MIRTVLSAVAAAGLLAGCGSVGGREEAAAGVAERWYAAVGAHDGGAACDLLAPGTAKSESEDAPCADAIVDEDLPSPGRVTGTAVYGQQAQVRLDGDTVFLAVFPGGWRVVAAGCESQPAGRPYDCQVEG